MSSDANSSNIVIITSVQSGPQKFVAHGRGWPRHETGPQKFVAPRNGPRHEKG